MKHFFTFAIVLLCGVAQAQVYNTFAPGGDLTGTNISQTVVPAAITLAKQANADADTIQCNPTNASAVAQYCTPIAAANLMSAMFSVRAAQTTGNITLSGSQTIDGIAIVAGQSVLVAAQTTTSQNGIYIANAGAWTRAINFPTGFALAQNCDVAVFIREGTAKQGHTYRLNTTGGTLTIGTSALSFIDAAFGLATAANPGIAYASGSVSVGSPVTRKNGTVGALSDCVSWASIAGDVNDSGDANNVQGSCTTTNTTTGHLNLSGNGTAPTASTGSIGCNQTDHRGCVTAVTLTNASLTITFGTGWAYNPACFLSSTTAQAALTVTSTTANVVFGGITIAAGTVNYVCF